MVELAELMLNSQSDSDRAAPRRIMVLRPLWDQMENRYYRGMSLGLNFRKVGGKYWVPGKRTNRPPVDPKKIERMRSVLFARSRRNSDFLEAL